MQVRVERITNLTDKIRSFTLQAGNGGMLPPFPAGGHPSSCTMPPEHQLTIFTERPLKRSRGIRPVFTTQKALGNARWI